MGLDTIIAAGNALARSLGHATSCPKASPAIPCTCRACRQQAQALDDWRHLTAEFNAKHIDSDSIAR